jgi:hypothetical protein
MLFLVHHYWYVALRGETSICFYRGNGIPTCGSRGTEICILISEVLKHPLLFLKVLKHALADLEVLKQQIFNTRGAETSTCISRGNETSSLSKHTKLIIGHDRSLICLKTMAHIKGLHDVIPS